VIAAAVAALGSLAVPATFTATAAFVPEVRSQSRLPPNLSGLAGQFGLSLSADGSQSPRFYAELAKSREIMEGVLRSRYSDPRAANETDSVTLAEILGDGGRTPAQSFDRALKKLQRVVTIRVDNQTNIVRLSVDSRYPDLAATVANRFIDYLNQFNAERRQSQARMRRVFVEGRIAESEKELRRAEEELRGFYERNRSWEQAPQLRFEESRLRRQVDIVQEVYVTLKREYETARIEEVNDSPVITLVDPAGEPRERSKPERKVLVLLAVAFGVVVGTAWAFGADYFDRMRREQSGDYLELARLTRELKSDVRRLLGKAVRRAR